MKITRREFFPAVIGFTAGVTGFANASETPSEDKKQESNSEPEKNVNSLEKFGQSGKPGKSDPAITEALRWVDPNLSSFIVNITYSFIEPIVIHNRNYKRLKNNIGNITEADLIHNNSDRWANAWASVLSYSLSYAARFPFTAVIANKSSEATEEIKRTNKIFSDFMTINTYYGQILTDRYLTNAFQHELRQEYKKLLRENPQYNLQPWAIPFNKNIQLLKEIYPRVTGSVSKDIKESAASLKKLGSNVDDQNFAIELLKSRRGQLNTFLVFLSYLSTFTDIPSLLTANTLNTHTANTATGRVIANLPSQSLLCKDLLRKLKERGDTDGYNEEKVMAAAGLVNGPIFYAINSAIQSVTDSTFGLEKYSKSDVAFSNLRELIGIVAGSVIYTCLQYKLESKVRANIKASRDGLTKESTVSKFARWYVEPD